MKVAYWPGCVSRGFTPELHGSMAKVAPLLDIELVELDRACCTGAGVIAEHNQELADTLNARTFALAQQVEGADLMMNICSTCQGAQGECQERLDANSDYRQAINQNLAPADSDWACWYVRAGRGSLPFRGVWSRWRGTGSRRRSDGFGWRQDGHPTILARVGAALGSTSSFTMPAISRFPPAAPEPALPPSGCDRSPRSVGRVRVQRSRSCRCRRTDRSRGRLETTAA